MPLKDLPLDAQPREKLLARGPAALADAELLAILLRTGMAGKGVLQLAEELLSAPATCPTTGLTSGGFGGIAGLLHTSSNDLKRTKGLGPAKRAELVAVMELARRALAQQLRAREVFDSPDAVKNYVQMHLSHKGHELLSALKKRGRWIYQQLRDFREQQTHIVPRQYVSGESHYYLGKQYQLKVTEDATVPQRVKMLRGRLEVTVRHKSAEKIKALLAEWYRERARDVFQRRLDLLIPQTLWVSERPPIRLRAMQTQWGNCSAKGCLTLNPWLVKASSECIDYVLLHELCHVAEHNHSEKFYRLMGQVMPGWEKVKKRLDGMAGMLLADM